MTERDFWGWAPDLALIAMGIGDVYVFFKGGQHKHLNQKGVVEIIVLVLLLFLGFGDCRKDMLEREHEREHEAATALIEQRTAPRAVTEKQKQAIVEAAREQPSHKIDVRYVGGDNEAEQFAQALGAAFQAGGWSVSFTRFMFETEPMGLTIVSDPHQPINAARTFSPALVGVASALIAAGYRFKLANGAEVTPDSIQLRVGHRLADDGVPTPQASTH